MSDYIIYLNDDGSTEPKSKNKKRRKILEDLEELELQSEDKYFGESDSSSKSNFLVSSIVPTKEKKKKEEPIVDDDTDGWLNAITSISLVGDDKVRGKRKFKGDSFDDLLRRKKKKKKKQKGEMIDYNKEFEIEAALYKNLLQEQNRFTDSLQKEYDRLKSAKSTARGISKTMTDLIENITQARSLSLQIVDKTVGLKKTTADLMMKQRKEFGASLENNGDMNNFASTYLKQMLNERQSIINETGTPEITDFDESDINDLLDHSLGDYTRSDESAKYLQYENMDVTVYAVVNRSDYGEYEFVAYDKDNLEIVDYPLPTKTKISVNDSTLIATDAYGRKYPIRWM